MKASKHPFMTSGFIILNKVYFKAYKFLRLIVSKGLYKITSLIPMYFWLYNDNFRDMRSGECHLLQSPRRILGNPFDIDGLYLTWQPEVGRLDSGRNCISNVRPAGLDLPQAAYKLAWLLEQALVRRLTGVGLKDESEQPQSVLAPAAPNHSRSSNRTPLVTVPPNVDATWGASLLFTPAGHASCAPVTVIKLHNQHFAAPINDLHQEMSRLIAPILRQKCEIAFDSRHH